MHLGDVIAALRDGLIVSCQPLRGGALDEPGIAAAFARAAQASGAAGVRIESLADLRAARPLVRVPIVGLVKREIAGSDVFITPEASDIDALAELEPDVIAFDATRRPRPLPVVEAVERIHQHGLAAMADIATVDEGIAAWEAGAEFVGTTLSGYAPGSPQQEEPDLALVRALAGRGVRVVAEGRLRTPEHATEALRAGAYAVTVGSAITRPEHITAWFVQAMRADPQG